MTTDKVDAEQKETTPDPGEMSETEIDENLEDSFPASDPPSWTLGSNHQSDAKPETEEKEPESKKI